jgi:hypothetical protein
MFTNEQIESLFLDHLKNAIDANFELGKDMVSNKEGSKKMDNGVSVVVHSNDHDTHFHIKHRERGINATFSFPIIALIEYRNSRNTFSSRELKNIITTCNIPMYTNFISRELKKRPK